MLIRGGLGLGIIFTAVWIYCLLDVIMTDEYRIRNLSKTTWIMIVLFTFEIGAVAWLVAGRPQKESRGLPYKGNTGRPTPAFPEYDRPGRFAATNPDADAEFLRKVRERADAQTREAKRQREQREAREREERDRHRAASQAPATDEPAPTTDDPTPTA